MDNNLTTFMQRAVYNLSDEAVVKCLFLIIKASEENRQISTLESLLWRSERYIELKENEAWCEKIQNQIWASTTLANLLIQHQDNYLLTALLEQPFKKKIVFDYIDYCLSEKTMQDDDQKYNKLIMNFIKVDYLSILVEGELSKEEQQKINTFIVEKDSIMENVLKLLSAGGGGKSRREALGRVLMSASKLLADQQYVCSIMKKQADDTLILLAESKDEQIIANLPFMAISEKTTSTYQSNLLEYIAQHITKKTEIELFNALAKNWTGTVGELVEASTSII